MSAAPAQQSALYDDAVRLEKGLIAEVLIGGGASATTFVRWLNGKEGLEPTHFWSGLCADVWRACLGRVARNEGVTLDLLAADLDPKGDHPERRAALDQLTSSGSVGVAAVPTYARQIKALAERRAWVVAGYELQQAGLGADEQALRRAERLLRTTRTARNTVSTVELADRVNTWLNDDSRPPATSSGIYDVDRKIGRGFRHGDLTFIGGHTGHGKSALVDGFLSHAAISLGLRAHVFGNEMSVEDRGLRVIADLSGVPYGRLAGRDVRTTDEWTRINRALSDMPFSMTNAAEMSVDEICRDVYHERYDLWAVDHLHNMEYRDREELEAIVKSLAACAASTGTHCLLVGQLNEGRSTSDIPPFPAMRDIRETGIIKHLASTVLFIHRDMSREDEEVVMDAAATLAFPKARHGEPGSMRITLDTVRLRYHGRYPALALPAGDGGSRDDWG